MAIDTPTVTLNNGNKMPQVGFGLWKVDNATCADTVYNAIKTGYRLFDGACGMLQSFSHFQRRFKMHEKNSTPSRSVLLIADSRNGTEKCIKPRCVGCKPKIGKLRQEDAQPAQCWVHLPVHMT
jgi:hypothetical protein